MAMASSRRSHFTGKAVHYFWVNHRHDNDSDIISSVMIAEDVWNEDAWDDI
jgi:hypothetical protein